MEELLGKLVEKGMEMFIKNLSDYVQDQFRWQTGMKKELERLQENQVTIKAVLSDARLAQTEDQALNEWIWQLRGAIDDANDIFDESDYLKHKKTNVLRNLFKVCKHLLKIDPHLKRLEEAVQKLDRVSADVNRLRHRVKDEKKKQLEQQDKLHKNRQTGCFPNLNEDLVGREKEKEFVIEWLKKTSNEKPQTHVTSSTLSNNISLLSIVGDSGIGKTTLLQHVYQDKITNEFEVKMWVCVSDSFDVNKVLTNMLESHPNEKTSSEISSLQNSLHSLVMSKKFLLVLDDLWAEEEEFDLVSKWEKVFAPLAKGGLGSKILITTQTDYVTSMIKKVIKTKNEILRLDGLKEDECLQVLTTHAFAPEVNLDDHKNLTLIARDLVKNLYGSPLLAKVMGCSLNPSLDEDEWKKVLNRSSGLNGIIPTLQLSYTLLPEYLQSCFSFCSIFEQDHIFDKDDLIRMWIAVGFIQPDEETFEDTGERYFDFLVKKSFFDKVSTREYKMHDLLHELAQSVSKQECFRFVGDEKSKLQKIPKTIRHLSFQTDNFELLKEVERFKNLQTLLIALKNEKVSDFVDALAEMIKVTRSIRLLHINVDRLPLLPENIKYLYHLRYLRFSSLNLKLLPRSISSLYHLQFLTIDGNSGNHSSNDYFPRGMNNLCNLRYLSSWMSNFPKIGKLKLLQQLNKFYIKNESGYRIEELKHMNELHILRINNLENVKNAEEASNAKLCDKGKLTHLSLAWDKEERDIAYPDLNERMLDNLQPNDHLKMLQIERYMGVRSAKWMNDANLIKNLGNVHLFSCLEWEILPPFEQLPSLKTLWLENMPKVERLGQMCCVFKSLEILHLEDLEAMVDWFDASVDGLFPCLTKLFLQNCPNLPKLPYLPPKPESLEIIDMPWKTLNCCSISKSIPLEIVDVCHCPNITSISLEGEIHKLKKLTFKDLKSLQFLPLLTNISSLEILTLDELPQLQKYPELPPSLKKIAGNVIQSR